MKTVILAACCIGAAVAMEAGRRDQAAARQGMKSNAMGTIAEQYVKLVLALGQHDADYVDAYYGPPEWKEEAAFWQALGDVANHAAAMANLARSTGNWQEAAQWHRLAGQVTLAAEAERASRSQRVAETIRIRREQATLF